MSPIQTQKNVKRLVLNRETLRTLAEPGTRKWIDETSCFQPCACPDVVTMDARA